jgi:hypothetical protein
MADAVIEAMPVSLIPSQSHQLLFLTNRATFLMPLLGKCTNNARLLDTAASAQ